MKTRNPRLRHNRFGSLCAAMLSLSSVAVCAADSGTLVWYRFEDLKANSKVESQSLQNEAGSSFPGVTDSLNPSVYDWVSGTWVVGGTNDWPSTVTLVDGTATRANARGVWFTTGKGSGCIRVEDEKDTSDAYRLANGSFTLEFFVKTTAIKSQTLVSRGCDTAGFKDWGADNYWRLELVRPDSTSTDGGYLVLTVKGGGQSAQSSGREDVPTVSDGKWHHAALTVDASTRTWSLFLDYKQVKSLTLAEGAVPSLAGLPIVIGCAPLRVWAGFTDGILDEFRVTGRVLAPREFLGYRATAHEVASDVAVYLPFDAPSAVGAEAFPCTRGASGATATPLSWNGVHPARAAEVTYGSATAKVQSDDMPCASLHATVRSAGAVNGGALSVSGNAEANAAKISVTDTAADLAGSYTVETFFKAPKDAVSRNAGLITADGAWYLQVLTTGYLKFAGTDYVKFFDCPSVVDGAWHHIACVYDKTAQTVSLYADYQLVGSKSGVSLAAPTSLLIGASYAGNGLDSLELDAFRVTARALGPGEFETSASLDGTTLFYAGLDKSLAVQPALPCAKDGALSEAFGATPAFRGLSPSPVTTADGTAFKDANTAALSFAGGGKAVFANPLPGVATATVELYARLPAASPSAQLAAFCPNDETSPLWALTLDTDGETLCFASGATSVSTGVALPVGGWRHVALVLTTPDEGNSTVKLLIDREEKWTQALDIRLSDSLASMRDPKVVIGGGTTAGLNARIDEVRVTEGALAAGKMLSWTPNGLALIVR